MNTVRYVFIVGSVGWWIEQLSSLHKALYLTPSTTQSFMCWRTLIIQQLGGGGNRFRNPWSPLATQWIWVQLGLHETLARKREKKLNLNLQRRYLLLSLVLMWLIGSDGFLPRFPREHHSTYWYPGKKIKIQNTIANGCKLHSPNPSVRNKMQSQVSASQEPLIAIDKSPQK